MNINGALDRYETYKDTISHANPYTIRQYGLDDNGALDRYETYKDTISHANPYDTYLRKITAGDWEFNKIENLIIRPKTTAKEKADAMVKRVIFNPPATIVFFADGGKEVVKCQNGEPFDEEKGLAMALIKHWVKLPVFNKMLEGAERKGLKNEESDNSR